MSIRQVVAVLVAVLAGLALLALQATRDPGLRSVPSDPSLVLVAATRFVLLPAGHVSIRFSEAELTAVATAYVREQHRTDVGDPTIVLQPNDPMLLIRDRIGGVSVPVTAHILLAVSGGQPQLTVGRVDAGQVPIPSALSDPLASELERFLAHLTLPTNIRVDSVEVDQGSVLLSGTKS